MTTVALGLDPVFKKFPTISGEAQKITAALDAVERGARLATGFSPYALACQNLITSSTRLRTAHKDLDAALQALSQRVVTAAAKIVPSEFLAAIRADDVKTVQNMLRLSDIQNKKLANGEMPLHFAIRSGSATVVKYLLGNAQANPLAKDHQGLTAFDHAFIKNDTQMIALVLGSTLGTQIPESAIPAKGDIPELQLINQEIAGLRRPPVSKLPPLHAAAFLDDLKGLEKHAGSDLNGVDANGMTALHYAVLGGREAVVKWLLAKGAKLDAKASNGMNLLHFAAISGSEPILKCLLDTKKFDLNAADGRGRTPLHFAIASDKIAIARTLIQRGGDPLAKTMQMTPFDILEVVSRIRAEVRDPLKLDRSSLFILGSFAASAACHYFGDAKKMDLHWAPTDPLWNGPSLRQYLYFAGNVLSALPVLGSLYKISRGGGNPLKTIPAAMGFSGALLGYIIDDRPSKSFFEGGHSLYLGKTLIDNLHNAWKNSSLETYRPLRNVIVHTANTLFAAYEYIYTSGMNKKIACNLGTNGQCIDQLLPNYEKPKECQGLENGVTDKLLDAQCPDELKKREHNIDNCLAQDTSALEKKIKDICESKLPTEDKITCYGLSEDVCNAKKNKAHQALKNCKEDLKSNACEQYFPAEDSDTCRERLVNEEILKKEACEQLYPEPLEEQATCKARVKPLLEMQAKKCGEKAAETLADAKTILDLSGETTDPEKALKILLAEFKETQSATDKIKQAYETIKNPPPTYTLNMGDSAANREAAARLILGLKEGHTKKECVRAFRDTAWKCHPDMKPDPKLNCPDQETIYASRDLLCP